MRIKLSVKTELWKSSREKNLCCLYIISNPCCCHMFSKFTEFHWYWKKWNNRLRVWFILISLVDANNISGPWIPLLSSFTWAYLLNCFSGQSHFNFYNSFFKWHWFFLFVLSLIKISHKCIKDALTHILHIFKKHFTYKVLKVDCNSTCSLQHNSNYWVALKSFPSRSTLELAAAAEQAVIYWPLSKRFIAGLHGLTIFGKTVQTAFTESLIYQYCVLNNSNFSSVFNILKTYTW